MAIPNIASYDDQKVVEVVARQTVLRPAYVRQVLEESGYFDLRHELANRPDRSKAKRRAPQPRQRK